jgi:dTDP-4-amino-4,6-dideoxygalactose transaminase
LEDSSQSHGAFFLKNKKKKLWGSIAIFSFYPGKNLGSITDGGAAITNSKNIFDKLKSLRNYGSKIKYYHDEIGFNSRLNSTSAIFLRQKLKKLNFENALRSRQEKKYINKLKDIKQLSFLRRNTKVVSSHHLFLIFLKERNKLKEFLDKNQIETIIHYPVAPVNQKYYKKIIKSKKKYPIASKFEKEALSLPLGKHLSNKQQDLIISTIRKFFIKL